MNRAVLVVEATILLLCGACPDSGPGVDAATDLDRGPDSGVDARRVDAGPQDGAPDLRAADAAAESGPPTA